MDEPFDRRQWFAGVRTENLDTLKPTDTLQKSGLVGPVYIESVN